MTFEPAVTVKFKLNSGFNIEGKLSATSTIFTAFEENQYWDWIYFKPGSEGDLEGITAEKGGRLPCPGFNPWCTFNTNTEAIIKALGAEIKIKDSVIKDSNTKGLWMENTISTIQDTQFLNNGDDDYNYASAIHIEGDSYLVVKNSTFQDNDIGIWIAAPIDFLIEDNTFINNSTPIKTSSIRGKFSGNIVQNNDLNGILVTSFGFSGKIKEINWESSDLVYILEDSFFVPPESNLIIEPGVVVKFRGDVRSYIKGKVEARGNEGQKIIFTSLKDDEYGGDTNNDGAVSKAAAGDWNYLLFSLGKKGSVLENVIIRYGGFLGSRGGVNSQDGALKLISTNITLINSLIENNAVGIEFINSSFTSDTKDVVVSNNQIGIYVTSGQCPDLSGIELSNNINHDIWTNTCQNP